LNRRPAVYKTAALAS